MDGPAFATCVEKVLAPEPIPGIVVILDNQAMHRNLEAARVMKQAGCRFLDRPPRSPDLDPIGQAFSKLKAHLRKFGARTFTEPFNALRDICRMFTPEECWNHFQAAGRVAG